MTTMARAATAQAERPRLHQAAFWYAHCSGVWALAGLVLAALAAGSWVVSAARREGGPPGVLAPFFLLYVLLMLLLV